ncbi:MAG: T9SS C-terminal target domain-containing protein [Bacteroidetes bacterium]|nr:MAG: T9SS C-terminal target domain-containing protein [Bacteroidota bacterium]REK34979.1 MAG: T9SS C-terminal target domain-containing protein [Bacteroidota bacterium]REK48224.1 MAG: T9SS C-terminal target domain-containing protein [Bacteroidota bacterium]
MLRIFLLIPVLCLLLFKANAQTLGNYNNIVMSAGKDSINTPSSVPTGTVKIAVHSSPEFRGILTARASDGIIRINNAGPVGVHQITVRAYNSSGASSTKTFTLTVTKPLCSDGTFNGNIQVPVARPNLTSVNLGDFNGDGKQDIAVTHAGYNTVSIKLGDGLGGFNGNTEVSLASHPFNLAIGDFNLDGRQDLAVVSEGADFVAIRLGDGTGLFNSQPNVLARSSPVSIDLGDFNGDGYLDFAVANYNDHNVSIRIGNGSGLFSGTTNLMVGSFPFSVAVGDLNNDGKHDFVTANKGSHNVSVRLGNGNGTFSVANDVPVGISPNSVVIADFNHDGKQDIATANFGSNSISIRLGDGAGNFSGSIEIPAGSGPYSLTVGNFNGDAHPDLVCANYFGNNVSVRMGDGKGGFIIAPDVSAGSYPVSIAAGEFNADRIQDFVVANYADQNVSVRLGNPGTPAAVSVSNNSPICEGLRLQFSAEGGIAYSWSGPNGFTSQSPSPFISVSSLSDSGIYFLQVLDSINCYSHHGDTAYIHPNPAVSFTLMIDSLCSSDPIQPLGGGSPSGGIYTGPGIVAGSFFDPGLTGPGAFNLTYTYTDSNECVNSVTRKIHILLCTGIEDESSSSLYIYPNPARDQLQLITTNNVDGKDILILSLDLRIVKKLMLSKSGYGNIDVSDLSEGVYFIQYRDGESLLRKKFIKATH